MTTTTTNETQHYIDGETWLRDAEQAYRDGCDAPTVAVLQKFAELHYLASMAADNDRLAACVPDGLDSFSVSVRGQR